MEPSVPPQGVVASQYTVVVAAASGPVGSLVGQLAKLVRARAVGIAGGPEKCAFVRDELRFDAAIDHRAADFPSQLAAACPNGIDVYFENVGGSIWQAVLPLLNKYARIPVCGLIAQYNGATDNDGTDRLPATMREIMSKSLTLRGFINYDFAAQYYADFLREVGAGIADGRRDPRPRDGVQRFKGLGEMNATELWETTMDPARRVLRQVTLDDAAQADELFTVLMGEDVEARRAFIQRNAKDVRFLDI